MFLEQNPSMSLAAKSHLSLDQSGLPREGAAASEHNASCKSKGTKVNSLDDSRLTLCARPKLLDEGVASSTASWSGALPRQAEQKWDASDFSFASEDNRAYLVKTVCNVKGSKDASGIRKCGTHRRYHFEDSRSP